MPGMVITTTFSLHVPKQLLRGLPPRPAFFYSRFLEPTVCFASRNGFHLEEKKKPEVSPWQQNTASLLTLTPHTDRTHRSTGAQLRSSATQRSNSRIAGMKFDRCSSIRPQA